MITLPVLMPSKGKGRKRDLSMRAKKNIIIFQGRLGEKRPDCAPDLDVRVPHIRMVAEKNFSYCGEKTKSFFNFIAGGASLCGTTGLHETTLSATIFTLFLFAIGVPVRGATYTLFFF